MFNQQNDVYSSSIKQLSDHYNTNNSNNNNIRSQSSISTNSSRTWKRTFEKILKRKKPTKKDSLSKCENNKHVHWIDENENLLNLCQDFVENLKLFVQNIINDQYEEIYLKNSQIALDKLQLLTDCIELKQAFEYTIQLAIKDEKNQLLQQQTFIAHLISRTILSC